MVKLKCMGLTLYGSSEHVVHVSRNIGVFDPDHVFKIISDPDPLFKLWGFKIWSRLDPGPV